MVRDDGTASAGGGIESSKPTGDWSTLGATSNYYESIEDAMNASPAPDHDDMILVSDVHDYTRAADINYTENVVVMSVDDGAMEDYKFGAKETITGTSADFTNDGTFKKSFSGITFVCGDNFAMAGNNVGILLYDCNIVLNNNGSRFAAVAVAGVLRLINSTVTMSVGTTLGLFEATDGTSIECFYTDFITTTGVTQDLFYQGGGDTGFMGLFVGCDMSTFEGYIIGGVGGNESSDDRLDVQMYNCVIGADLTGWIEEGFLNWSQRLLAVGCSEDNAHSRWQFYQETFNGTVTSVDDASVIRTNSDVTFDGGKTISFRIDSTSDCTPWIPLIFKLPTKFLPLSAATTDHIEMHMAVETMALTDTEFWAEVNHRDGTDLKIPIFRTSRELNLIADGTPYDDDSGSSIWEDNGVDLVGWNEYKISVDTTEGAGASDSVPSLLINCGVDTTSDPIYVSINVNAAAA